MATGTMTSSVHESLTNVIDYLPGAVLLLDVAGGLCAANRAGLKLLGLERAQGSLYDRVDEPQRLRATLDRAFRASDDRPLSFRLAGHPGRIAAVAQPVCEGSDSGAAHLLLHCQGRDTLQSRMRLLNRELTAAIERQKTLRRQNDSLRHTVKETLPKLREQSYRDALTGVFNRRYFDRRLAREWQRAAREGSELSLVYADIDWFKAYNDAFGHVVGDRCLRAVGRALASVVAREFDCVCRLGGEEFALLLPMTDAAGARHVADRAQQSFHDLAIAHPGTATGVVTASFGVGTCRPDRGGAAAAFVATVDRAMYRAKQAGRDRVHVSDDDCRPARALPA